jgi:hypothetical protein
VTGRAVLVLPATGSAYRLVEDGTDLEVCALLTDGTPSGEWTDVEWRGLDPALEEQVAEVAFALQLVTKATR